MASVDPSGWFIKCGGTALAVLALYVAVALWGPKAPPLPTSRDGAITLLDRYMEEPVPDVLLAGSSLTARLNEGYFDTPDLEVLGLAGGSPITALEVALGRDRLPLIILIEMNILGRSDDPELVRRFSEGSARSWPRPIRSGIAFYERWHHPPPDRNHDNALAASLLRAHASNFDNHIYLERATREWSVPPSQSAIAANLMTLKRLVEAVEARGSRVLFYSLPLAGPLEETVTAKLTSTAAHAAFPQSDQWIDLDGSDAELRWADGVHLDERSAALIAKRIDRFLKDRGGH